MHYLLYCEKDDSYVIINKRKLLYDDSQLLNEGDDVAFFYKKEKSEGKIEKFSEDLDFLKKELKALIKRTNTSRFVETRSSGGKLGKRQPIPKKIWTPTEKEASQKLQQQANPRKERRQLLLLRDNVSQERVRCVLEEKKKGELKNQNELKRIASQKRKTIVNENEENIKAKKRKPKKPIVISETSEDECDSSYYDGDLKIPNDDEDKALHPDSDLAGAYNHEEESSKDNEVIEAGDHEKESSNNDDVIEAGDYEEESPNNDEVIEAGDRKEKASGHDEELVDDNMDDELRELMDPKEQLICLRSKEEMEELKDGIGCLKNIYETAIGSSKTGSSLARRLIPGVFTVRHLLRCTYTGASPHAQGNERLNEKFMCLNNKGKKAIHDFVIDYCEKKNWAVPSEHRLHTVMSQKIGEIRRLHQKNKMLKKA